MASVSRAGQQWGYLATQSVTRAPQTAHVGQRMSLRPHGVVCQQRRLLVTTRLAGRRMHVCPVRRPVRHAHHLGGRMATNGRGRRRMRPQLRPAATSALSERSGLPGDQRGQPRMAAPERHGALRGLALPLSVLGPLESRSPPASMLSQQVGGVLPGWLHGRYLLRRARLRVCAAVSRSVGDLQAVARCRRCPFCGLLRHAYALDSDRFEPPTCMAPRVVGLGGLTSRGGAGRSDS